MMYPKYLQSRQSKVRGERFEEWIAWSTLIWFVGRIAGKQKRHRDPGSGKIRGFSQMTALLATRLGNSLERWFRKKID